MKSIINFPTLLYMKQRICISVPNLSDLFASVLALVVMPRHLASPLGRQIGEEYQ